MPVSWEKVNNPDFNYAEFDTIKSKAGLNNFRLSAKEWMEKTHALGIVSKAGRYGGTHAHKDIAFEFAMWISPELLLVEEGAGEVSFAGVGEDDHDGA